MTRRVLLILLPALLAISSRSVAQDDPEYRLELGAGIGTLTYLGDLNGQLGKNVQPMLSAVAKYKMNVRMNWALNVGVGQLKGSTDDVRTWYPATADTPSAAPTGDTSTDALPAATPTGQLQPYRFSHRLVDAGLRFEYNFWPYGTGREYYGARRLTPFVAVGLGLTVADAQHSVVAANVPLGAGLRWKAGDRLNLIAEWTMRFTGSDELDGLRDPYGIRSSGLFKNTDCYSGLQLSVTYDLWAKCKTCNSDRD